jgi:hypothetical protein
LNHITQIRRNTQRVVPGCNGIIAERTAAALKIGPIADAVGGAVARAARRRIAVALAAQFEWYPIDTKAAGGLFALLAGQTLPCTG